MVADLWRQGAVRGEGGVQRRLPAYGARIDVPYDDNYDSEGEAAEAPAAPAAPAASGCASSLEVVARELAMLYLVALLMATMPPSEIMPGISEAEEAEQEPTAGNSQADSEESPARAPRKQELTNVQILLCARPTTARLPAPPIGSRVHLTAPAGTSSTSMGARL